MGDLMYRIDSKELALRPNPNLAYLSKGMGWRVRHIDLFHRLLL